jgi:hypothetical protein
MEREENREKEREGEGGWLVRGIDLNMGSSG